MIPYLPAVEHFLAIFIALPQPIRAYITTFTCLFLSLYILRSFAEGD